MTPLRLLLIEDSEDDAALIVRELSRSGYDVAFERVDTPEGMAAALERQRWDLAIADYTMPRFTGTAALTLLREYDADMPFIFVSGTIGEDAAVAAMRTGAHDYIMKGNLKRLVPAVERELRDAASRISRKQAEAKLEYLAYHDTLTDLPNRVLLHDRLQQALLGAERAREPLALLVLDLDGFKAINDSLGHHAGDRLLQELASRLRELLRDVDTVARLGGDEFAIVLPRTDGEGATLAARKVLQELNRPVVLDGRPFVVGGSLGIAWFPEHGSNPDALLQKADIAMYVAKSGRFGHAVYAPDRDRHAHRRFTLMTEFREAIENGQFSLDYQPIVDLRTGRALSVEALVRWDHPQHGRLPPSEFIEFAEQTWLIEPLTMLLLDKAIADWGRTETWLSVTVAVNLSPRTLRDVDLPDRIANILQRHGAGYSSLSYLRRLPVAQLKIDRSFASGLELGDEAIVRSTIDLAHNLGLIVVAEGVESAKARDRLLELGCDAAQGTFIAEPAPAAEIRHWVARQHAATA